MGQIIPFLKKSTSSVGIELGSNSVKMVETIRTRSGFRLLGYAIVDAPRQSSRKPERNRAVLAELIREALSRCRTSSPKVYFSVAGYSVRFGRYRLPPMPEKELLPAIIWKGKNDFPFDLNDAVVIVKNITPSSSESSEQDIFVIAARKNFVQEELSIFTKGGIQPKGITTVSSALAFVLGLGSEVGGKTVAVLDLGARHTELAIIRDGRLSYARFIASGSEDITLALTEPFTVEGRHYHLNFTRAEQIKHTYGIPMGKTQETTEDGIPLARIMFMIRPVLEKLVTDILRSFDFYKMQTRHQVIERIYICGGGASLKNLPEFLTSNLGVQTIVLDPFERIALDDDLKQDEFFLQNRHRLGVALGLSIGKCRDANLLPPPPGGLATTDLRSYVPVLGAVLLAFLGLSWYLDTRKELEASLHELKRWQDAYTSLQPSWERLKALKQERDTLQAELSRYPQLETAQPPLPEICLTLTHLLPQQVKLSSLVFENAQSSPSPGTKQQDTEPVLRIEGMVEVSDDYQAYGILKRVTDAMKENRLFRTALLEATQKTHEHGESSLLFVIKAFLNKGTDP